MSIRSSWKKWPARQEIFLQGGPRGRLLLFWTKASGAGLVSQSLSLRSYLLRIFGIGPEGRDTTSPARKRRDLWEMMKSPGGAAHSFQLIIVSFKESAVFFCKAHFLVVKLLFSDISGHRCKVRFADAQSPVANLPGKICAMLVHPSRGIRFYDGDAFANARTGGNRKSR